jgi:hypothetical protein
VIDGLSLTHKDQLTQFANTSGVVEGVVIDKADDLDIAARLELLNHPSGDHTASDNEHPSGTAALAPWPSVVGQTHNGDGTKPHGAHDQESVGCRGSYQAGTGS